MKGPLHVIRRRRAERPANGVETAQAATEAPTQAQPTADLASARPSAATDQAPAAAEVPAGQEPVPTSPSFRQRGRLRRRLRYLRRVRELGFRDLGGLVFDQHRFSQVNTALVDGKLAALAAVDRELRALEVALDERRSLTELREPGISVCSRCGALHGSEARFCPSCGTPVRGPRAIAEVGEAVSLSGGEIGALASLASTTPPPPAQPVAPAPLRLQPLSPLAKPVPDPAATPAAAGEQPTDVAMPAADDEPAAPAAATAEGEQRTDAAMPAADGEQAPTDVATPAADGEQPKDVAPPAADGEQPTAAMRPVDEETADGDAAIDPHPEAVAQPTGERGEP